MLSLLFPLLLFSKHHSLFLPLSSSLPLSLFLSVPSHHMSSLCTLWFRCHILLLSHPICLDSRCPALIAFILSWVTAVMTVHHLCPLCSTLKASPWVPDQPCSLAHKGDPPLQPHSCSLTRPVSHLTFSHTPYTSHP